MITQGPIDLSQLPSPHVVEELSFEEIYAARKAAFIALHPEEERPAVAELLKFESEPIVKLLQENAYRELLLRQRVNEAAQAVMLAYATGSDLDQVAANFDVERLVVAPGDPTANPPRPPVLESDESLRLRAQNAFEGLSVAGPRAAYIHHARRADGRVADVTATSPAPCEALITVLSHEDGGIASPELLAIVEAALTADDVRPLGDRVTVQAADIVDYTVEAVLYLPPGPEAGPVLAEAEARLRAYTATPKLGRSVWRSALIAQLHAAGVSRVALTAPAADIVLDATQAARCTGITLTTERDDG